MLKVCIVGLSGRMGHVIFECCQGMDGVKVISGIAKNDTPLPLGFNGEIVDSVEKLTQVPEIFIDFSRPDCSLKVLAYAKEHGCRVILGTTGFDDEGKSMIVATARSVPIVFAANFSVGVNVMLSLIKKTAAVMQDADLEIVEAHHRYKVDAPSGTALAMGEAAADARGVALKDVMVAGRHGITGERNYGTIGFSSIRGGDVVGEHQAMFLSDGERVVIEHVATSRSNFARGALRAAVWLEGKKPGLYSMNEVLGLDKI
ncbi:MAG: 4-hydroxy-tetrahydrodipicolinate reductase [Anaerobiospirillum sp.]|nr:4-hydroxy-tetrahydrodipicolinate reductase [Anaerobiospirillum sp.]